MNRERKSKLLVIIVEDLLDLFFLFSSRNVLLFSELVLGCCFCAFWAIISLSYYHIGGFSGTKYAYVLYHNPIMELSLANRSFCNSSIYLC